MAVSMDAAAVRRPVRQLVFRAMGTEVQLLAVGGDDGLVERGRELVDALEVRWSRFRAHSELCRLNAAAGRPVSLSGDTFALVAAAVDAWRLTAGLFDPTVLTALVAAGCGDDDDSGGSAAGTGLVGSPSSRRTILHPCAIAVALKNAISRSLDSSPSSGSASS